MTTRMVLVCPSFVYVEFFSDRPWKRIRRPVRELLYWWGAGACVTLIRRGGTGATEVSLRGCLQQF